MQLQFLTPVEVFFQQLSGCSFFTRAELLFFKIYSCRAANTRIKHEVRTTSTTTRRLTQELLFWMAQS